MGRSSSSSASRHSDLAYRPPFAVCPNLGVLPDAAIALISSYIPRPAAERYADMYTLVLKQQIRTTWQGSKEQDEGGSSHDCEAEWVQKRLFPEFKSY